MKTDLLLASAGVALVATTAIATKLRSELAAERRRHQTTSDLLRRIRRHLAASLDSLREVQAANTVLQHGVNERDRELVDAQSQLTRAADSIAGLIRALNAANARCAELQNALNQNGLTAESAYFLAALSDGTVAGPFSRN